MRPSSDPCLFVSRLGMSKSGVQFGCCIIKKTVRLSVIDSFVTYETIKNR